MKKSTLSALLSSLFLVAVLGCFYMIWTACLPKDDQLSYSTVEIYSPVDVSGVKSQAKKLIDSYENYSNIPIPVPVGKMGKSNPFTDPE